MTNDLPLTPDDVEEIVTILTQSHYQTLEIETTRFRLKVARAGEGWSHEWAPRHTESEHTPIAQAADIESGEGSDCLMIRSPLPGTFYRAPQPGAEPFIQVGDRVTPTTEVAIVETMKLMTTVSAGVTGTVVEIVPDDATPIDANAVLIRVQPD